MICHMKNFSKIFLNGFSKSPSIRSFAVIAVTKDNYNEEVVECEKPVLVKVGADWCGACKKLDPLLETISDEIDGVKFVSVDVDNDRDIAISLDVEYLPHVAGLIKGEIKNTFFGFKEKDFLIDFIDELMDADEGEI